MTRLAPLVGLALLASSPAEAHEFTFTIENNSDHTWSEGVLAVLRDFPSDTLLKVGLVPQPGANPQYASYKFGHSTCDPAATGDPDLVVDAFAPTVGFFGGETWIVPSLAPGESVEVTIDAEVGEGLSFVAWVEGSDDDVVMMNVPGERTVNRIPLFNYLGQPLFNARFDIGGYDVNTVNATNGRAANCGATCPPPAGGCYVAPDNHTVRTDAGGSQTPPVEPIFGVFPGYVFAPRPNTFYENGIGSPTVVYRRRQNFNDFVMIFETRLPETSPDCPGGLWGLGIATSNDGVNWTAQAEPILRPTPGTFYACVAAHPTAINSSNAGQINVWFKGEQGPNACPPGVTPPAWGCGQYTGVGHLRLHQHLNQFTVEPALAIQQGQIFGFPTVARVDNTFHMLVQTYPSFFHATATTSTGPWTVDPNPVMQPGVTSWSNTEVYNPALVCEGTAAGQPDRLKVFFGGRTRVSPYGAILEGGIGEAISSNGTSWMTGVTPFQFDNDQDFRHWDVLRLNRDGQSEYLMYFTQMVGGKNHVRMAATTDTWFPDEVTSGYCPAPGWWGGE